MADDGGDGYVFHMKSVAQDDNDEDDGGDDIGDIAGLLSQAGAITDNAIASGLLSHDATSQRPSTLVLTPPSDATTPTACSTLDHREVISFSPTKQVEVSDQGLRGPDVVVSASFVGRVSDHERSILTNTNNGHHSPPKVLPTSASSATIVDENAVISTVCHQGVKVQIDADTRTYKGPNDPTTHASSTSPFLPQTSMATPPSSSLNAPQPSSSTNTAMTRPLLPQQHRRDPVAIHTVSSRSSCSTGTAHCKVAYITALRQLAAKKDKTGAPSASTSQHTTLNTAPSESHWSVDTAVNQLVQQVHDSSRDGNAVTPAVKSENNIALAVNKLSKPTKKNPKSKQRAFATVEDARECRFHPKKSQASVRAMQNPACGYDFVSRTTDNDKDFIGRMDAAELNRQKRLETTRGEEAYNVRQNKKQCPKCGMVQSYAEYRDKKKRCTFCGIPFVLPKAWGDVGRSFLERMEEWGQHHEANQLKIRHAVTLLETNGGGKSSRQKVLEKRLATRHTDDPLAFIHEYLRLKQTQPTRKTNGQRRIQVPANLQQKIVEAAIAAGIPSPDQHNNIHDDKG
ncbi:hypothetical protein H257_12434 [Aphanomyces astaci]|uniref:Uncharacterized protein n=1 Tax=Aphanomyces astaci TaxID=112090 RepID=W4FYZ9_APHAT|nr:hypothetical protein H257_12434 [Aphanomyces astaci]ETV72700.1 hypothetical protein H257_12434 [Aphanomyces astaci]|eukprot:XP_009837928.1 hypothetical protein H257_12434 [Aphanomyces astaci]